MKTAVPLLLTLLVLPAATGCRYASDRLLDLTDIVDLKGATGELGLGAKVEATQFVNSGLAYSGEYDGREWFGRYSEEYESYFMQFLVAGFDGLLLFGPAEPQIGCICLPEDQRPLASRFRFGGELVLPGLNAGLYLNVLEVFDFLLGFATLDPAGDDGTAKGAPFPEPEEEEE